MLGSSRTGAPYALVPQRVVGAAVRKARLPPEAISSTEVNDDQCQSVVALPPTLPCLNARDPSVHERRTRHLASLQAAPAVGQAARLVLREVISGRPSLPRLPERMSASVRGVRPALGVAVRSAVERHVVRRFRGDES